MIDIGPEVRDVGFRYLFRFPKLPQERNRNLLYLSR